MVLISFGRAYLVWPTMCFRLRHSGFQAGLGWAPVLLGGLASRAGRLIVGADSAKPQQNQENDIRIAYISLDVHTYSICFLIFRYIDICILQIYYISNTYSL